MSGCERTFATSSLNARTWSSTTLSGSQEASWPLDSPIRARSSLSLLLAMAQRV